MRLRGWWLGALVACFPLQAVAEGFGDLQVIKGMDALERGDDAQALMQLAPVADGLNHGEVWLQARYLAATATGNLGLYEQTLTYLQGLDKAMPEVADFITAQRARTLRGLSRWAEARDAWQLILDHFPSSPLRPEATYGVADAWYGLRDYERAFAAYDAAQKAYPKSDRASMARFNMARIEEEKRHNLPAAAALYRQLVGSGGGLMAGQATARLDVLVVKKVASAPGFSQRLAVIDRLISARTLDEAEQAIAASEDAVPDLAGRAALDARRAALAYRKQDFPTAVELLKALVTGSAGRQRLDYQRLLANVYSAAGQFDNAIAIYKDIAQHYRGAKEGRDAQYRAAWLAYNGGDHANAVKLFGEFITTYPSDRAADEAMWYIGWNAYRMNDLPTASEVLGRLRKSYKHSALLDRTFYWQGRIAVQLGQKPEAIDFFEHAAAHPNTYYGMMARARLDELQHANRPSALQGGNLVASLEPAGITDSLEPEPENLPPGGGMRVTRPDSMPWGASVFDWSNPEGKRALRLMKLGLRREAARIVGTLPVLAGFPKATVTYSRARLLFGLGDYAAAYRLVSNSFRPELDTVPNAHGKRYFQIAYPDAHAELVNAAAKEFGVSPLLVLSIMRQESAFDDQANSWASARGLMQIIPVTGRRIADALQLDPYNDGVLREPVVNVRFGTWYLAQLVRKFEGNYILAIGAYNAGPQAMQRWVDALAGGPADEFIEDISYRETRHYVKNVVANLAVYSQLYGTANFAMPTTISSSYRDNVNF